MLRFYQWLLTLTLHWNFLESWGFVLFFLFLMSDAWVARPAHLD